MSSDDSPGSGYGMVHVAESDDPWKTWTDPAEGFAGSSGLVSAPVNPRKLPAWVRSGYNPPNTLSNERFSNISTTICSMRSLSGFVTAASWKNNLAHTIGHDGTADVPNEGFVCRLRIRH